MGINTFSFLLRVPKLEVIDNVILLYYVIPKKTLPTSTIANKLTRLEVRSICFVLRCFENRQKFIHILQVYYLVILVPILLIFCSENYLLCQCSQDYFPTFSSVQISASGFVPKSLNHLDVSLVQADKYESICILSCTFIQLDEYNLLNCLFTNPNVRGLIFKI